MPHLSQGRLVISRPRAFAASSYAGGRRVLSLRGCLEPSPVEQSAVVALNRDAFVFLRGDGHRRPYLDCAAAARAVFCDALLYSRFGRWLDSFFSARARLRTSRKTFERYTAAIFLLVDLRSDEITR